MDDPSKLSQATNAKTRSKTDDKRYQRRLHKYYSPGEEEYHNAYPDTRYPWTIGFLRGFTGRYRSGYILWAIIGVLVALGFWISYMYHVW